MHIPVLTSAVIEAFGPPTQHCTTPVALKGRAPVLVDCTLGGAGHTHALLMHYPNVKVLACDFDQNALDRAQVSLKEFIQESRLTFVHTGFNQLTTLPRTTFNSCFQPPWAGILLDLGYSSDQLEDPQYGISFQLEGPLDMRLSRPPSGVTAWQFLCDLSVKELAEIFKTYGELPNAVKLAELIKTGIQTKQISNSTLSLADFLKKNVKHQRTMHPATLVFQSLRIAVNDELRGLDHFLENVILKLSKGARIVILTFHSLEDRIVKQWGGRHTAILKSVTKKPLVASPNEVKKNPRARSAKLRVYEMI